MSLQDDIARELPLFRAQAESRMTSRCTIKWQDPEADPVTDADGYETAGWTVLHEDLPCFVDKAGVTSGTRSSTVGGVEVELATRVIKVPHDTTDLVDGAVAFIVGGATDGRFFRLVETTPVEQKKQQEFPVVETSRPEGWS